MTTNLPAAAQPINWEAELRGAAMLIKSQLAPRDIKTPEAALFCILAGRDLGLSPVQSLRSIRPIQGKIELSADLQLGLFARDGGKFKWLKLTETEVELQLQAPWLTEPHVSRWTMQDAQRAGLANGDNWKKYPRAMLRSRAITAGLKDIGYLQGAGVYAPGEIGGGAVVDHETGEVLPTSDVLVSEVAQMPKPQQVSGDTGVEDLVSTEKALEISIWQNRITDAYLGADMKLAYAHYMSAKELCESAEEQALLWKGLDKKLRTELRRMYDEECAQQIKEGAPK